MTRKKQVENIYTSMEARFGERWNTFETSTFAYIYYPRGDFFTITDKDRNLLVQYDLDYHHLSIKDRTTVKIFKRIVQEFYHEWNKNND